MTDQPKTRQELYNRIRNASRDEVILEEMIRLGFLPKDTDCLVQLEQLNLRENELEKLLKSLLKKQHLLGNQEKLLKALRKKRLAEARAKRAETKARLQKAREDRAEAWKKRKAKEILYLGEGVSGGLQHTQVQNARLKQQGLPLLQCALDIADAMDISMGDLCFLTFKRGVSKINHYRRFWMPKKLGGQRLISAPMPRLKRVQHWILEHILSKVVIHEAAHGFVPQRSIITNAQPHVGADVVINLDLQDFFPTISYPRIRGLFSALGYSEQASIILALLCTEPQVDAVELDGETYYVASSERQLPQGAPTSPALSNIICRRLDRRLLNIANSLGFIYTRYADDLSFSAADANSLNIGRLLRRTSVVVAYEGFVIHPDKTHIMHKGRRQEVTGLIVNQKLSIDRRTMRRFRATLFQIEKDGPDGKRWGHSDNLFASILGFSSYVAMVDPDKGKDLLTRTKQLATQYGYSATICPAPSPIPDSDPNDVDSPAQSEATETKEDWWKLW